MRSPFETKKGGGIAVCGTKNSRLGNFVAVRGAARGASWQKKNQLCGAVRGAKTEPFGKTNQRCGAARGTKTEPFGKTKPLCRTARGAKTEPFRRTKTTMRSRPLGQNRASGKGNRNAETATLGNLGGLPGVETNFLENDAGPGGGSKQSFLKGRGAGPKAKTELFENDAGPTREPAEGQNRVFWKRGLSLVFPTRIAWPTRSWK